MGAIKPVLFCPNSKLLTEPWEVVAKDILRPAGPRGFVSEVVKMSTALGEINRWHSKTLPDEYFKLLQKRMTEIRRIVGRINKERKLKGKGVIIPWEHLEYLFSGGERRDMKR